MGDQALVDRHQLLAAIESEEEFRKLVFERFLERDEVEVAVCYLEGVADGRKLLDLGARALALKKPILVWIQRIPWLRFNSSSNWKKARSPRQ